MATELQRLIVACQKKVPSFELHLSQDCGSLADDYRLRIRKDILSSLAADSSVTDLSRVPRLKSHSVSISHTFQMGGWASVTRPDRVGFDMETLERIKLPAVERICTQEEVNACPDYRLLWGAKESLFKALEDQQPKVFSGLKIDLWVNEEPSLYRFEGSTPIKFVGYGLLLGDQIYSICLI